MKHETPINRAALMAALEREYGLEVVELTFIPEGEVGQHYLVTCADQRSFFLTVLSESRLARLAASRLDFYLVLTSELYERELFRQLAPPIRTQADSLRMDFNGQPVILCPYIQGKNLMESPASPADFLERQAKLIAQLHESTTYLQLQIPYVEKFSIPFEETLLFGLNRLEQVAPRDRAGRLALRVLLLPNREVILSLLARLHELAELAVGLHPEFVLCHTDANLANWVLDEQGELFLVDWEGARLAPAEHDLFIFTGDGFPEFLRYYRRVRPQARLSAELFGFYFYQRKLEDLTDWIVRILDENTMDEQDQHDLEGVMQDCVSGWAYLEEGIEVVRQLLADTA